MAAVGGHHQRARTTRGGAVHVGPGRDEEPGRGGVAAARREQQRRVAALHDLEDPAAVGVAGRAHDLRVGLRAVVHPGPGRQQQPHDLGMPLGRRPHERGLPVSVLSGVGIGAVGEQRPHRRRAAGAGRGHQRRLARRQDPVRVGPRRKQRIDRGRAAVVGGQPQRRHPQRVRGADGGAGREQKPDRLHVVPVRRPVQGGGAVAPRAVDVGALVEQRPQHRSVLRSRGVGEGALAGLGVHGSRPDRRQRQADDEQHGERTPLHSNRLPAIDCLHRAHATVAPVLWQRRAGRAVDNA